MNWYLKVVRDNYVNFKGRARRKEYWMFVLFNLIFGAIAAIIDNVIGTTFTVALGHMSQKSFYGWIYMVYMLAIFLPGFAVFVRRLHDVGKSGWWIFIGLIPIIGGIWLLVLLCTNGDASDNAYGPSPKAPPAAVVAETFK